MLAYSLGKDQSLVIGDRLVVRVIEVRKDEVLLEIEDSDGTSIRPGEDCQPLQRKASEALCCC
jgi:sRNA-binding carbon storage regulator CsrA